MFTFKKFILEEKDEGLKKSSPKATQEKTVTSKEKTVKKAAPTQSGPVASGSSSGSPSKPTTPAKSQSKIPQNIEIDPSKIRRIEANPLKPVPKSVNPEKAEVERKEVGKRGPKSRPVPEPEVKSTANPGLPPKTTPPVRPTYSKPEPKSEPKPKPSVEPIEKRSYERVSTDSNMSHTAVMRHYHAPQRIIDRETTTTVDRNKVAQPTGTDTHTADGNIRGNKSSLKMPKFMQAALAARNKNE